MTRGRSLVPLLALWLSALPAVAAPPEVPPQLQAWVPWVLEGHEEATCPGGAAMGRLCGWPTSLELEIEPRGATFRASWERFAEGWVHLPGSDRHFPQDVRVNGVPHPVLLRAGVPSLEVGAGSYVITGRFAWDSVPNSLRVPQHLGLLSVKVRGTPLESPRIEHNTLFFVEQVSAEAETPRQDTLEVRVHRVITDGVPLHAETTVRLEVSGRGREVVLGRPLLEEGIPLVVEGELPLRLEPDGRLRVQVRAGVWTLRIRALHTGPATALTRPEPGGVWDENDEIWAFQSAPEFRLVTVTGVPSVDPAQTSLPQSLWQLPMYAVAVDTPMRLQVERRGDSTPSGDRIQLRRELWLDFDGGGYTAKDTFQATLSRSWRLSASEGTTLGRVSLNDEPQFITRLPGETDAAGVEVRQGIVQVSADSRLARSGATLPAIGWAHDVESLEALLHLPAGWRLLHASGVDQARTWVSTWTLLDIFLLVIIAFATGRLYGWKGGLLALAAVGLSFHEPGAPRLVWLSLLCFVALLRVLPKGHLASALNVGRWGTVGILLILLVGYSVAQVRQGLHPVLEQHTESGYFDPVRPTAQSLSGDVAHESVSAPSPSLRGGVGKSAPGRDAAADLNVAKKLQAFDRDSVIQTGPGLPSWRWTSVRLGFSGPVQQAQELTLWLMPPWMNQTLAFLRVILLVLLGLLFTGWGRQALSRLRRGGRGASGTAAGLLLGAVLSGLLVAPPAQAAPPEDLYPSQPLLEELRTRLTKPPSCAPECTTLNRMRLELSERTLRARLQISAEATSVFELPGSRNGWTPESVRVNGRPASALQRSESGVLRVVLSEGLHEVLLEGSLPARSTLSLHLPSRPMYTEVLAQGWTVEGLQEDGRVSGDLQLARIVTEERPLEQQTLQATELPPYLRVERTLTLGTEWSVETVVHRMSEPGRAVVTEIPLVPGESVTSPEVEVRNGRVLLNLGPQVTTATWSSRLERTGQLALAAPDDRPWSEVWRLRIGALWNVEAEGLPPIHQEPRAEERVPTYHPWPGETLTLSITRPVGVGGSTLTIDSSELVVRPGQRNTDVTFAAVLRSSRGGPHVVTLPEGATLTQAQLEGRALPLRQEGRAFTLPLSPGLQRLELRWNHPEGIGAAFVTPTIDLGAPSVNASLQVHVPGSRWLLWTAGPPLGPAVLFWPTFLVLLVIAFALSRLRWVPLRAWEWLLLAIGLSQIPVVVAAVVPLWLIALGWRKRASPMSVGSHNATQLGLVMLTLLALVALVVAIHTGLLSSPDMRVEGNGSRASWLAWYQDRAGQVLPTATVYSVPLLVFRLVMLAWALWLAASLLKWLRFGWSAFTEGGLWKHSPPPIIEARPGPPGPPPPPSPPPTGAPGT